MSFLCPQCPGRSFRQKESRKHHYRSAPDHAFCAICQVYLGPDGNLDLHHAKRHGYGQEKYACSKCKTGFLSQSSLEDHYRGKPDVIHPNCPRCRKGFFDNKVVEEHLKSAHPIATCCGQEIYEEDLPTHYKQSNRHPSCRLCVIGFKDDQVYAAHGAAEHPDLHCATCERQFDHVDEIRNHFSVSPSHPKCPVCVQGFLDDVACVEHSDTVHKVSSSVHSNHSDSLSLSDKADTNTTSDGLLLQRNHLPPPRKEINDLWRNTVNAVVPCSATEIAPATPVHSSNPIWGSDTIALPSGARGSHAHVGGQSTTTNLLVEHQAGFRSLRGGRTHWQHLNAVSILRAAADPAPRSTLNAPAIGGDAHSTPRPHPSGLADSIWASRQAKPAIPRSGNKLLSTSSSLCGSNGESTDMSSGTSSGETGETPPTTRPHEVTKVLYSHVVASGIFRCICNRAPPVAPTAINCGHVFCYGCINTRAVKSLAKCPKCRKDLAPFPNFFPLQLD